MTVRIYIDIYTLHLCIIVSTVLHCLTWRCDVLWRFLLVKTRSAAGPPAVKMHFAVIPALHWKNYWADCTGAEGCWLVYRLVIFDLCACVFYKTESSQYGRSIPSSAPNGLFLFSLSLVHVIFPTKRATGLRSKIQITEKGRPTFCSCVLQATSSRLMSDTWHIGVPVCRKKQNQTIGI